MNQIIARFRYPFVFLLILIAISSTACNSLAPLPRVQITELVSALKSGEVSKLRVNGNIIQITYNNGDIATSETAKNQPFEQVMMTYGVTPEQLFAAKVSYENLPFDR